MTHMFSRRFDQEAAAARAADAAAPQSMFTQEDIDAARAAAYAEGVSEGRAAGRAEGRKEAEDEISARVATALETAHPVLSDLLERIASHQSDLEDHCRLFAMSVCEKVFPVAIEKMGRAYVTTEIDKMISAVQSRQAIVVTLSPITAEAIEKHLSEVAAGHSLHLTIRRDPDLPDAAFRAEWSDGFADGSYPDLCAGIIKALRQLAA